jgi:heme-degrading monooxygenase HmoA
MGIRSLLKLPVVGYSSEEEFLKDLNAMTEVARKMKGFMSVEIWKSQTDTDPPVYLVESEWETREDMSAMEHQSDHEEVMSNYPIHEPIHLRLVPWVRPS